MQGVAIVPRTGGFRTHVQDWLLGGQQFGCESLKLGFRAHVQEPQLD